MAIVGGIPEAFDSGAIENLLREVFVCELFDRTTRTARTVNATDALVRIANAIEEVTDAVTHLTEVIERGR